MTFTSFCKTCPYYVEKSATHPGAANSYWHSTGECHKNAPYGQGTLFPQVDETDWCGGHPGNSIPPELVVMELEDPLACDLTAVKKPPGFSPCGAVTRCGSVPVYQKWE